jgi:hypothetical protein
MFRALRVVYNAPESFDVGLIIKRENKMTHQKTWLNKLLGCMLAAGALAAPMAQAGIVGGTLTPVITSGALPDSPGAHVDANSPTSAFSGVVSINIRYDGKSYICSGALVGKRSVVSAGHCVDTDGNGHIVDINAPGNDVRVIFNNSNVVGSPDRAIVTATAVSMNANYQGFGNCPAGVNSFCVNDDVSVITLGADAPASAKIYKIATNPLLSGTHITMAGYGTSGDGVTGFYVAPSFRVKRSGENYVDLFDADDELGFTGANEVYYADFDGAGKDTFCTDYGVCTPQLPNDRESGIGGGDSGGPSFVNMYGELMLVANNTFSGTFSGQTPGTFGTYFGGIILSSYADYLNTATGGQATFVPEPGSIALFGLASMMLFGARRRSKR